MRTHVKYLLAGGGVAAAACVEAIRQLDRTESILLVAGEISRPYDRGPLSKTYLRRQSGRPDAMPPAWLAQNDVTLRTGCRVAQLDTGRRVAGLDDGGEIAYVIDESGRVSLHNGEETDPVLDGFLAFLARDMTRNPASITAFPAALAERMAALTDGMDVDLDEEIDGAVTL